MSEKKLNILISGAGIAGTVLAYWLLKTDNVRVTIIERSPEMRLTGQEVDIHGPSFSVIRLMNLEAEVRRYGTGEEGIMFIDEEGKSICTAIDRVGHDEGSINEVAIARGKLAQIIYKTIEDRVKIVFGEYVKSIERKDGKRGKITVSYANGRPQEEFDLVVAADGLMSKLRGWALETDPRNHLYPLQTYIAFFTMKQDLLKGSKVSRWFNSHGGRAILVKPCIAPGRCFASLISVSNNSTEDNSRHLTAIKKGREGFEEFMTDKFADAGWRSKEIIDDMKESDDLYYTEVSQVHTDVLYRDRVVFVGDAGYCPTPFTGMGASMAIIGAYILAGQLANCNGDIDSALEKYQANMLPYAKKGQSLFPGIPRPLIPQSKWGLAMQRIFLRFLGLFFGIIYGLRVDTFFWWCMSFLPNSTAHVQIPRFEWNAA